MVINVCITIGFTRKMKKTAALHVLDLDSRCSYQMTNAFTIQYHIENFNI